jgi:hypothetical protein
MKDIGRTAGASGGGNSTKRIRIRLSGGHTPDEIKGILRCRAVSKNLHSLDRLPTEELRKVSAENIWNAIQKLLGGAAHRFGPSTDFDLIVQDGVRLPPKAVFGLAASEALGFDVLPRHFSAGIGTPCFMVLEGAGYQIAVKGDVPKAPNPPPPWEDIEWTEGKLKLILHLKRERAAGLSQAKKARFTRDHGKLYCERCRMDPVATFGGPHRNACIEVHHHKIHVEDMSETHRTKLEDLQCLCANCHRVVHRLLKEETKG